MDGSLPVTGGGFVTDTDGVTQAFAQVSETGASPCGSVTDDHRGVKVSLSEAVKDGHVPGATLRALQMDRHRSNKGELPPGLTFPQRAGMRGEKTELFWSAELSEFNASRRGSWPAARHDAEEAAATADGPPPVMPGGIPAGGVPDIDGRAPAPADNDPALLVMAAELVIPPSTGRP